MDHLFQLGQSETRALFSILARERGLKISLLSILSKADLTGEVSLFPGTIFCTYKHGVG